MQRVEPLKHRGGGRARRLRRNVFLLAVLVGACDFDDCTGPEDLFDVAGLVTINGQPAQGITVNASGETATTQADGTFRLTFVKGNIVGFVSVQAPARVHFREANKPVGATDDVFVTFEGFREAALTGRTLALGQPVPGVQLEVLGPVRRNTTSAADGSYRFDDLPPSLVAPYFVRATGGPSGYEVGPGGTGITLQILGVDVVQDLHGDFHGGVRVRGSVTSSGIGLGDVTVAATGAFSAADTTNSGGDYFLPLLPPGTYDITIAGFDASAHRFTTTVQTVAVTTDTVVDFAAVPILPNQAPAVAIQQPANGSTFAQGSAVAFLGSATDPEDGPLGGASLTWSSSLDGTLGTGTSLTVSALAAGDHTITLAAVDAQGLGGNATVTLTITAAPQQPGSITGTVTANGFPIGGVTVALTGTAAAATATNGSGVYSFTNLAPGSYTVTITNPFSGVTFPALAQTVTLASGQSLVVDFAGSYGSLPPR